MALKNLYQSQVRWLTPVIPATWEVEIGRISFGGQTRQKVSETPSQPIKMSVVVCVNYLSY
jgi:hypothetical protein